MSTADYRERSPRRSIPEPVWHATNREMYNLVITPCEPIPLRLSKVRVQWEPSSFVVGSDRKNIFFELNDDDVHAFIEAQEDKLKEEWGLVNTCLAKQGLL